MEQRPGAPGPRGKPSVVIATTYYHPILGGVETHARQLASHLHRNGFAVQVVTKRVGGGDERETEIDGVPVHRIPPAGQRTGYGKWLAIPFFFFKLLQLRDQADVIVCIDYRGIGI